MVSVPALIMMVIRIENAKSATEIIKQSTAGLIRRLGLFSLQCKINLKVPNSVKSATRKSILLLTREEK